MINIKLKQVIGDPSMPNSPPSSKFEEPPAYE